MLNEKDKEEDWLMLRLCNISRSAATFLAMFEMQESLYQIDEAEEQIPGDLNLLKTKLMELLEDSKINEAEDLLFEAVDANNMNHFLIASDFYYELSRYDDDYLNQCHFSRAEIDEGVLEIQNLFNINNSIKK